MISTLTKRVLASIATVVVATAVPLAAFASYAPDRAGIPYTDGMPGLDHVQFNTFTGTNYGDERTFFDAKNATNTNAGGFQDVNQVTPGEEVLMRVYVHNDADTGLNDAAHNFAGVATNTRVRIDLPTATANELRTVAYITADNATPKSISDTVDLQNANTPFSISYVPGSARLNTNVITGDGAQLPDSIISGDGAQIGYDKLDGRVPGCFQYTSLVTFKVKVNTPQLTLTKQVGVAGTSTDQLKASIASKVGETDGWMLTYHNSGTADINNVVVRDQLPAHLQIVPGSVKWKDGNHLGTDASPYGTFADNDLFDGSGVNIGTVRANQTGYIFYRTTVKSDFAATDCNVTLSNHATVNSTGVQEASASASVVVATANTCTPTPTPTPTTTPTPTPLPATGAEDGLLGVTGIGSLGYAARAYLRSKKSLLSALKK